jgi:cytochrome c-type biogenesis protein CcmE
MRAPPFKVLVGAATLAGAATYLAVAASSEWVYYRSVDEFVGATGDARARVYGVVGPGAQVDRAAMTARFELMGDANRLRVIFSGPVPDLFAEDRPVVVEGIRAADGTFIADIVMTRCASKYEPKVGKP